MNEIHRRVMHTADFCVVGGGLSGVCAALAAARHGAETILIHDRPVPGGNCSSEIRMWVRGAGGEYRESGIVSELDLENIYRNPHMNAHLWDAVLYGKLRAEPNLKVLYNCSVYDAETENGRIVSVSGWQLTTYTVHTVKAALFADCSGDSILAPLAGDTCRIGREGRGFGEKIADGSADTLHMGMSCLIQARETDHPVEFIPPDWAERFTEEELEGKAHDCVNRRDNMWWIEVGGNTADGISDTEECRDRLLAIAFGVWDHIKNGGDHGAENFELEWIGFLPGKRESRRYIGYYILTADDLTAGTPFEDIVAYGGWTMDDHDPRGIDAPGYSSKHYPVKKGYPIPYRCLFSKNIDNLFFAGRNISATHLAMSSTRVMATCSLMGQAVGTAAALAAAEGLTPREVYESGRYREVQRRLMNDGCWLPTMRRETEIPVSYNLTEAETAVLMNGIERPFEGKGNYIVPGGSIVLTPSAPVSGAALRVMLDPDYTRVTINTTDMTNPYSQKSHRRLDFIPLKMPADLPKCYTVEAVTADGERRVVADVSDNRSHVLTIPLPDNTLSVIFTPGEVWGGNGGEPRVFACDLVRMPQCFTPSVSS